MPPQQPDRLLDFVDHGVDFGAHGPAYLTGGESMAIAM